MGLLAACASPRPPLPPILPGLEHRVEAVPRPAPPPGTEERLALPLWPTPEGRLAFVGGRLAFDVPRGWKLPVEAPGGAVLVDGTGKAGAGLAFHPEGAPEWEDPADFKRRLRALGSVEDSPLFETVTLGKRFGVRRRWTTHRYKGKWSRLGAEADVLSTETMLFPDLDGIYVFWFRAPKAEFAERRAGFSELLRGLALPPAGPDAWRPSPRERRQAVPAAD